jgi:hypothetical protein
LTSGSEDEMHPSYTLYLGPYAEWRLRPREIEKAFREAPFWEEVAERLWMAWTRELPPIITVGRVKYHRYCFCPHDAWKHPAKGPLREFRLNSMTGILDLREVETQAELDWFTREYGPLLERVGERLGRAPILHWGVVALHND